MPDYRCWDFNIHIERDSEAHSVRLNEIIDSFGCIQQVPHVLTQREGRTLDLIITMSDQSVSELFVDLPSIISKHSLIHWCPPFAHQPPIVEIREVRSWHKVNRDDFRSALGSSKLCDSSSFPETAEEIFDLYCSTLQSLADEFTPV